MECGPVNPLISLKKQLDKDVLKDSFRGSSSLVRGAPPPEVFLQQKLAEEFIQHENITGLPQNLPGLTEPFVFQDMQQALKESRPIQQPPPFYIHPPHGTFANSSLHHTSWQNEFQSFHHPSYISHSDPNILTQFEDVFHNINRHQIASVPSNSLELISSQEQTTSWNDAFNSFQQTSVSTLTEEENATLEEAFKQVQLRMKEENETFEFNDDQFQAGQWAKEFAASNSELAEVAGEVLDALNHHPNPQINHSEFTKFMQQLKNNELEIEGGDLIEKTSWGDEFQKTIDEFSHGDHFLQQGIEKDWAESFDLGTTGWEDALEAPYTWDANLPQYQSYHMETENPFLTLSKADIDSKLNETLPLSEEILLLEAKLTQTPENSSTWFQLGIKQQENEKEQQAITALRQALKLDPGQLNAWLALAVSYTNENRSECATDSLKGWLLNHPQYHTVLPTSSSMTPSSAVLADYFLKAVHVATHVDPDLQVGLGVLFNLTENYERAVDCFQVALACRPYDAFLWNKLGATLANSNQSEKAIDAYFRALQINPNYIRARYNLGIACIHLKQHKEAVHQLLQALQFQQQRSAKGSPHIWDSLKMACLLLQKFDWAQLCDVTDLKELQAAVLRG